MSDYFPEELWNKIFLKLPINSIVICTAVCKSWYGVITSPTFISEHLKNQENQMLIRYCSINPQKQSTHDWYNPRKTTVKEIYASYSDNDNENFDQYTQFLDVPFKLGCYLNIVGSFDGVLCLSDDINGFNDLYYLWNPSIRKSVQLPKPIFTFHTYGPFYHTLGFGFDPLTNDYKVVRIVEMVENYFSFNRVPPLVELYKLSTGVWQDITHAALAYKIVTPGVYVNGACHWVGLAPYRIVLFDVHDEIFREMMLPSSAVLSFHHEGNGYNLFVSEETLCLADPLFDIESCIIHIWRMKEYGDPESWVKQYSINSHIASNDSVDPQPQVHILVKPIVSRRNGEILWRKNNGDLVSYDIAAEKVKDLGIHNANFKPYRDALYVTNAYKVSLVLLDKRTDYTDESKEAESIGRMLRSMGRGG